MFDFIENLRNKSETYRHTVAISTALVVTLVLFGVWMTVLFPSAITGKPVVAERDQTNEKPFTLFRHNAAQTFEAVKIQWKSIADSFSQTKYESNGQIEIVSPDKTEESSKQMQTY